MGGSLGWRGEESIGLYLEKSRPVKGGCFFLETFS